jgi:two-component system response regulator PhoP
LDAAFHEPRFLSDESPFLCGVPELRKLGDSRHAPENEMRVLVVEDERRLAENIATALRDGPGFAVDQCHDGEDALLACGSVEYDLLILDLMLPRLHGSQILRKLRARGCATPVLILTAVSGIQTTINLLDLGADDYMTKPFDLGELVARARALIRRGKGIKQTSLAFGNLVLNAASQVVQAGGRVVELSPTEYRILEYLMHHPKKVVSKRELLEHLYDFTWEHHSNVVEAHVSNLRRKLRGALESAVIENMRGRGYRLSATDEAVL